MYMLHGDKQNKLWKTMSLSILEMTYVICFWLLWNSDTSKRKLVKPQRGVDSAGDRLTQSTPVFLQTT